ncbi:DUF1800 domain-containing protein [Brevundimonas sp. FT23042]|uniref:DUF1800 domain-containing protein n=1 Tax=Brevundimonas sp. FT23042 TaxID=3393749 RepID=UPI003B5880F0
MTRSGPLDAALALTRFGMGAKPGEIAAITPDPRGWLEAQARPGGAPVPAGEFETSDQRVARYQAYLVEASEARRVRRDASPAPAMTPPSPPGNEPADSRAQAAFDARRDSRRELTRETAEEFLARARLGATTDAGFAERWSLFWANAFTASATKFQTAVFLGQYEREAIRPHVFGRFEDLAQAAESHPAMLLYLDQAQSIGPNSVAGQRRQSGLNENLAREILELHTVGADGGYSQADVTEFARALTGWSLPRPEQPARGRGRRAAMRAAQRGENGFTFLPVVHEPGERTVMGRRYPAGGVDQGRAILSDLANRPETARRLARRIANHFVADAPSDDLVTALERAWTGSRGDLAVVARALVTHPASWTPEAAKMKTPYEFVVSAHRAMRTQPRRVPQLQQALVQMGQPAWAAPSPEGWPDTAADWAGPDALVKRLNWAKTVGDMATVPDAVALAEGALGERLSDRSRQFVARAESRAEAVTLFLMSPEFQRR